MGQPTWRVLEVVTVPVRSGALWTPGLDYLTPGKLYRVAVEPQLPAVSPPATGGPAEDQQWKPDASVDCTADGNPGLKRQEALIFPPAPAGALIGKIGGSAADLEFDKDRIVVFTVGRHCVFVAPEPPKVGGLYLGVNDTADAATRIAGSLQVTISQAL